MNPRAKRLILPLGGAIAASSLIGASLVSTASASTTAAPGDVKTGNLSSSYGDAKAIASFWTKAKLKSAKIYSEDSTHSGRLSTKANKASADGKAGVVKPTGSGSNSGAGKSRNVNLPKTVGKVFFEVDGKPYWCSGSSVDAQHRNLIATAGHCVYDTDANKYVENFVFIPGYYHGKAPWGIYVGAKVNLNADFTIYEDYDHDYAFVNVYNGIKQTGEKEVAKSEFEAYKGVKYAVDKEISEADYKAGIDKYGPAGPYWAKPEEKQENVGPSYPGAIPSKIEVTEATFNAAPKQTPNPDDKEPNGTQHSTATKALTENEYNDLLKEKAAGKVLGKVWKDDRGFWLTQYYVYQWIKKTKNTTYYITRFYVKIFSEAGRLGDNVGGQGFAWNQKLGKKVFVFGYPTAAHPDGDRPYSGQTQKWCYGTTKRAPVVSKYQAEEHVGIKCAFTPGSSGGPFLLQYRNATRVGYLNGVVSLTVDSNNNDRYDVTTTPYFDSETYGVYKHAASLWTGKLG